MSVFACSSIGDHQLTGEEVPNSQSHRNMDNKLNNNGQRGGDPLCPLSVISCPLRAEVQKHREQLKQCLKNSKQQKQLAAAV